MRIRLGIVVLALATVVSAATDPKLERDVDALLASMTLEEKVAQLMQPAVHSVKPEDVKKYRFGSVLNGGGGFPGDIRKVTRQDWLALADRFHEASMDTSGGGKAIPVIWGSDAVHGHTNVVGATIFPHNIGLGATRNPELIRRIGEVTATEMAITGIDWDFSPVVAVARDDRWGRTYESYSEDPEVVRMMAGKMVEGIQNGPYKVVATAKHFLADGGTYAGKDGGDARISVTELRDVHAPGYASAIDAGVMTVMVSQSSWNGREMHGNRDLLTELLKRRMGFDGILVGDWNGHAQVPWCSNESCAASLNAGLDMFMVPDDWKALYENTLAQVRSGEIPQARIDDAVRRILRVKMRAGLFTKGKPSQRAAAKQGARFGSREHRNVARQAVRESIVLLKNNGTVLPVRPSRKVLVAGDGADSISKQSGGWTISWQGDGNTNKDFPGGTSIWSGIKTVVNAAGGKAQLSPDGSFQEKPDVAIVVFGENPYAEWEGDRKHIIYDNDKDLALLRRLKDAGVPVVSVFLSGRPLWVNPFLNASDAFVAAWLPGSEGNGIADVLFADAAGKARYDFRGKLSFSWPRSPAQVVLNRGDANYDPLFPFGFGLTYKDRATLPQLPVDMAGVDPKRRDVFFAAGPKAPWEIGADKSVDLKPDPGERRRVTWAGQKGDVYLRGKSPVDLSRDAQANYALAVDVMVEKAPSSPVMLSIGEGGVDITSVLRDQPAGEWRTVRVPLRCFATAGANLSRVDTPFRIGTTGTLGIRLADIELVPAGEGPVIPCAAAASPASQPSAEVMFDDFSYSKTSDMPANGWILRTKAGWPGVPGALWGPESFSLHDGVVRMTSSTNGTVTRQSQLCHQRKYLEGTYAARVRFTDTPTEGPDGDAVVQTFYMISPLKAPMDLDYSEIDFEYLPNGGWGRKGPTMFGTTWETFHPEPEWKADNESGTKSKSYEGWRTLVAQVSNGMVRYFIDGEPLVEHGGRVYPEVMMSINFNLWFARTGLLPPTPETRRYIEDIDWVYFNRAVLSAATVESAVADFRARGVKFRDTVPASGLTSPCDF